MAFRNPLHSLPASAILGLIPGTQISGPVAQATAAANLTGLLDGSQVSGTVAQAAQAANLTGLLDGSQVSGPVAQAAQAGNLTGPLDGSQIILGTVDYVQLSESITNSSGQKWWDFGNASNRWECVAGALVSESVSDASGGVAMVAQGYVEAYRPDVVAPFDPRSLYRVSATVRQTVAGSDTAQQRVYVGLAGLAADKTTFVNIAGSNSLGSQAYCSARGTDLVAGSGWQTFTGYVQGFAPVTGDGGPNTSQQSPMRLHPSVRYVSPLLYLNYLNGSGTVQVDSVSIELLNTGVVDGSVSIIPGTVVAETLAADAIDGKTITGATVRAVRTDGSVAAVMEPDLGDGEAGFQANSIDGTTYARLEQGQMTFGSSSVNQHSRTGISGSAAGGQLDITSGYNLSGGSQAHITLSSGDWGSGDGSPTISLDGDGFSFADMAVNVNGVLMPKNFAWGRVDITPVANTPTNVTVTGLNVAGTAFTAFVTADTTLPGTSVTGVSATAVMSNSVTVWITRTSTQVTTLFWMVLGAKS